MLERRRSAAFSPSVCSYCTLACAMTTLSNLHLSNQAGVWCLIWQLNPSLTIFFFHSRLLALKSRPLFSRVTPSRSCALTATVAERSFRLLVTILATGGGTRGAQLWNYLHNCKVKAILTWRGGNKELSVWAAPLGPGEILSAATAPPTRRCLLGRVRQRGRVGSVPRQCHVPRLHSPLSQLVSPICMSRLGRS